MRHRIWVIIGILLSFAETGYAERIGPADKLPALRTQLSQSYPFIVRFVDGVEPSTDAIDLAFRGNTVTPLPLINGLAIELLVRNAFAIAERPDVLQVWYLHPDLAGLYVDTIAALGYNVRNLPLPTLVNLSIAPAASFWREQADEGEPIHAATKAAADAGLIPVVAIGNSGQPGTSTDGWINPWCYPRWVICVGAYDYARGNIAHFSSRGAPGRPNSWPDVVAHGVDVIGAYPTYLTKSPERKARDESNARFRELVPREDWNIYTLESSTSQATANVTAATAQVLHFIKESIRANSSVLRGQPLFSVATTQDAVTGYDDAVPRLTGTAERQADGSVVYHYVLDDFWRLVKQLLVDTALPVIGHPPHAAGAGLVDRRYVAEQFGEYGPPEIKLSISDVAR